MAITRTAMIDDSGSGTDGTVINNAWKQELYNQIDALGVMSTWLDVAHNAANYTAKGSMTWSVSAANQAMNRYTLIGKTLIWNVYIGGATLGGTASDALYITIPGGFTASANAGGGATSQLYDGIHQAGFISVESTGTKIRIQKITEATFSLGVSYVRFLAVLEIT